VTAAEAAGFDGITISETGRDALIASALALEHSRALTVATEVAVAFPRSPMVTAMAAWELQRFSDGRFVLGLGTQVKGHIVRRFSSTWDRPSPRLREYIQALRAIWAAFRGDSPLDFSGEFYRFDLLPREFNPGGTGEDVPIHIAAVNPFNVRLAGEVADGLRIHRFHSARYLRDVIQPALRQGTANAGNGSAGRQVEVCAMAIVITGATPQELHRAREDARRAIAFYGSTRTYSRVMAAEDQEALVAPLHALSVEHRWDEMAQLIDDAFLEEIAVVAPYRELANALHRRYGGSVDRVSVRVPSNDAIPLWGAVLKELRALSDSPG
jgi:probable F420-dependent oxidoreductase